ncbi:DNA gyrase/topoisomerase IV subunit A [Roseburia intestinalis]|jgi:DNA gyrase subunit A|uniref:DNA topoisomerase (ATP-hydrolyzing) n=2 Tax=Roseburia intestinalis L1-82 TaxID=536231 RepID=C7GGC0_9FIRM|nr:DNA topoisomerase (ATP-hydrolyzing) [Roseburia intestinalis]EEU99143.1 DNA gyrase/topoisomerase IV, A subunit [Roseburia intestinalis L1-82]UWP54603.1 DNA topoisomerase 4 subunit A [Roseburia intestinalis]
MEYDMNQEEQIIRTEYSELMQKSYIDYAMSVIIARALPDVRDGLKPVQRRTLYDMYELGIRYDKPYRKCARIVGDTMGKYHPHGDSSIYDALVVMAQDFKKGLPLVDGHGNFGSIEGDGAAAMRYTEARLQKITQEAYLADLDKDVVNFVPNFDETEKEPEVLPVKVPNLLLNGAEGIAVGMTTSIPPHNFGEVIDGVIAYMKDPDINTEQMMQYIPGPDFPTGGIVANKDELLAVYSTGMGKIKIRGKVEVEKGKGGKDRLVITEIPYTMIGANIGKFLNDIYSLVETKKTSDIVDITNQSSKEGIRIVLELKKGADVENLKNLLYKKTKLEDTFGVNMLAVADGKPETMGIVPIIRHHVNFQYELATRKYQTLLAKERDKKEIQEGLIKATDVIDLIIEILRGSKNVKDARACLTDGITDNINFKSEQSKRDAAKLRFTERQTTAILEMRLQKLIGLELEALLKDHDETLKNISKYEDILGSRAAMAKVIIKELESFKKEYAKPRKTVIDNLEEAVVEEKKIEEMDVVFLMDRFGYAKTVDVATYERNKEAANTENRYILTCKNTDKICIFTNKGQMHLLKVLDLPYGKFRDKGTPIDNLSNYNSSEENFVYITNLAAISRSQVLFGTKSAMLKVVDGSEFDVAKRTTAATKLNEGDELIFVQALALEETLVMQSEKDFFLRIDISSIPEKKKGAVGVRGMKLGAGDALAAIYLLNAEDVVNIEVKGKEVALNRLRTAGRDTKGTKR